MTPYDANFLARILFTIAAVGCSIVPAFADLNRTHATNPLWTGHARFHVVWQVISYLGIGATILYLLWLQSDHYRAGLYIAAALIASIYAGFFTALGSMPTYGGKPHDENGYLPLRVPVGRSVFHIDLNVTVFSCFVVVLVAGLLSIL